jgi:hypothetical protein
VLDAEPGSELIGPGVLSDGKRLYYTRIDATRMAYVESRPLEEGPATTVFSMQDEVYMGGYWFPDRRLSVLRDEPDPDNYTCNFWQIRIDLKTGKPIEELRRMTD